MSSTNSQILNITFKDKTRSVMEKTIIYVIIYCTLVCHICALYGKITEVPKGYF